MRTRAGVVTVVLALMALLNGAPTARGQETKTGPSVDDLASADGFGYATPVGVILRFPAAVPGGALLSRTSLTLDKARATVAAFTPGELGEAFLQTTLVAPPGTPPEIGDHIAWSNPTLLTAQTPPSDQSPTEGAILDEGVNMPPFEAASLRATTTDRSAAADAVGGVRVTQGDLTIGTVGSNSETKMLDDGTVVSEAHAYLTDIDLAGGLLHIGAIDSTARVELRPNAEPVQDLRIEVTGATVAGVPVVIDQDGVRLADPELVGGAELEVVNEILDSLSDEGLSVTLFPGVVREADEQSVRVAGAAISIRGVITEYVPSAVDTPVGPVGSPLGDAGTDNELLLGQVEASAYAAERGVLPDLALSTPTPPVTPPSTRASVTSAPMTTVETPSSTVPPTTTSPDPSPDEVATAPAGSDELDLIRRQAPPGVAALRAGYRWILMCALVGVAIYVARRRSRLA